MAGLLQCQSPWWMVLLFMLIAKDAESWSDCGTKYLIAGTNTSSLGTGEPWDTKVGGASDWNCTWVITTQKRNHFVQLESIVTSFDDCGQCRCTSLTAYDGKFVHYTKRIASWCDTSTRKLESQSESLTLILKTIEESITGSFFMLYRQEPVNKHIKLFAETRVKAFSSRYFPETYPTNIRDTYLILSRDVKSVVCIETLYMSIQASQNCKGDYLQIYDGSGDKAASLWRWCGYDHSLAVCSSHSSMYIVFASDNHLTGGGFTLTYNANSTSVTAAGSKPSGSFVVTISAVPLVLFAMLLFLCCFCLMKRRINNRNNSPNMETMTANERQVHDPHVPEEPPTAFIISPPSYDDVIKMDALNQDGPPAYDNIIFSARDSQATTSN